MVATLKKTEAQTKELELELYLKKKTGLKGAASPFAIQIGNDANDNNTNNQAFKAFVEKARKADTKEHAERQEASPTASMIAQAGEDVKSVIQIAKDEKLDLAETEKFIQQVKNFRTLQAFKEESVANYSAPAMDGLLKKISPENTGERPLDIHKLSDNAIGMVSMDISLQARQNTSLRDAQEQFRQLNLANQSPETVADAYVKLDPENDAVKNLNQALETMGADGEPPEATLANAVDEELDVDTPEIKDLKNTGYGDRFYASVDGDLIKLGSDAKDTVNKLKTTIEEPAVLSDFKEATATLAKDAFDRVMKPNQEIVKGHKNVDIVVVGKHGQQSMTHLKL